MGLRSKKFSNPILVLLSVFSRDFVFAATFIFYWGSSSADRGVFAGRGPAGKDGEIKRCVICTLCSANQKPDTNWQDESASAKFLFDESRWTTTFLKPV
jgi:hypothetical protein